MAKINVENDKIKNSIMNILIEKHPLSAKEISSHPVLSREKMPYSAIHKTLEAMAKENKLKKHKDRFSININWIKNMKLFSSAVENKYSDLIDLDEFKKTNEIHTFIFDTTAKADEYRKRLQLAYITKKQAHPYCGLYKHMKSTLLRLESSINVMTADNKEKNKVFLAIASDTPIDRWCADFYAKNPMVSVKLNANIQMIEVCESMVLGDIIVQKYIPKHLQNYIDYVYGKIKHIEDLNIYDFYQKVYKSKAETKIVVIKNIQIADTIREQILSQFK